MQLLGIRYTLSGGILLAAAVLFKARLPRGRELAATAVLGIVLIGSGNGALVFAESWIPSGLASIFVSTQPFWMTGIESLLPRGERLHLPTVCGMLIGLCGTILLVGPGALDEGWHGSLTAGFLLLQLGCCGWSLGSVLQRRVPTRAHPVVSGAVQQLATGLFFLLIAAAVPQPPMHVTNRGAGALAYLVTFGSIVGYSAYAYALENLPVSLVSIYGYVNPAIAVFLGWMFYAEIFHVRELFAMVIIFVGVAIVKRTQRHASVPAALPEAAAVHDGG